MDNTTLPLHLSHVQKSSSIINRSHTLLHSTALIALIYYRIASFFKPSDLPTTFSCLLVFTGELILSFIWFLGQAYRFRPVTRTVFPERLPENVELPAVDVFICTADPSKEPTLEVMNTVISAIALDYPPDKLHVYLSDDGGCSVTLEAMKEAWRFAKGYWVPFCRAYGIKTRCPEAYFFGEEGNTESSPGGEFMADREKVKEKYENFKSRVMRIRQNSTIIVNRDHVAVIEVINDASIDEASQEDKAEEMPLLVYVSREKRPSLPHHFKAGALNVLLRVSAMISNSPYILVLDCDMYCNDPTSARQAMCFHLDPKISPSLGFVQFPQKFHNISKTDVYDSQLRYVFKVLWQGMDGLQGPLVSGTGFYIKREALYANPIRDVDVMELKQYFGPSNEFIKSFGRHYKPKDHQHSSSVTLMKETQYLASCAYENETKWGKEVGFLYLSVAEDYLTSLVNMHCKGWKSVYCDPVRPAFLGAGTTNLNDVLVQSTRWSSSLVEVGLSRFCPLIYGPKKMSALQTMCYGELAFFPFYFLPLWCFATIPQLCLLNDIAVYPEASNWFFMVFSFVFLSSVSKHIQEVLSTGGSMRSWINEQRIWMIKSVTCHLYGSLDAIMKRLGMREAKFMITNKVIDDEQTRLYQTGKIDFQTSIMLLAPLVILTIINVVSFVGGVTRAMVTGKFSYMFIQVFLSLFIVTMGYPVIEGMILRKDKGRIPPSVTILSVLVSTIFLSLGSLVLNVLLK
ncbi:cellulose synthase A catalytic subunit 8 [UDP-forming]-like isoform X1 [Rhododendron vialii]|uniref:cellulose synthase A catalytic subunit 8 [UDP-forming]-like isoform X1 n=1 Tax=Rhododendron vialii TaxID=182163 RepID=UPI00265EADE3|nr:cellulose synthase A catalytic subunit 8 [UDP-forming]-like isoform X1 [Rhododendron vialii]